MHRPGWIGLVVFVVETLGGVLVFGADQPDPLLDCAPTYLTAEPDSSATPTVSVQIIGPGDVWLHTAAFASPARCQEAARLLETVLTRLAVPGVTVASAGCYLWEHDR